MNTNAARVNQDSVVLIAPFSDVVVVVDEAPLSVVDTVVVGASVVVVVVVVVVIMGPMEIMLAATLACL